jgi:uncharacterized cupin superfamily protein
LEPHCLSGPLHVHEREDAVSYVLHGCMTFQVADEVIAAPAGTAVVQPRGLRHTFWNATDAPACVLDIVTPGGLEHFYEDIGDALAGDEDAMTRVAEMERRFGIRMDWASEPALLTAYGLLPANP